MQAEQKQLYWRFQVGRIEESLPLLVDLAELGNFCPVLYES